MNLLKLTLIGILFILINSSCKKITGYGPVISEIRNANGFSEIESQIAGDLRISQDSNYSLIVEGQQNILDQLITEVRDNRLNIRFKNGTFISGKKLIIHITTPTVEKLYLNGSGNIAFTSPIESVRLYLKISGSGDINLQEVNADDLDAKISGSGEMTISGGSVHNETLNISGSGNMDFINLKAENADIALSGSGDAQVYVTHYLNAKISGSGNIYYKGTPAIDADISGSGSVKRL